LPACVACTLVELKQIRIRNEGLFLILI